MTTTSGRDCAAAAPTGGNQPAATQSPYLALNWCICIEGIYPSRP